jgi:uncharacterized ferritin-like protein (DUF455 family)
MNTGPFQLSPQGQRPPGPRSVESAAGIGDRLRTAAFAELQAIHAFGWAADKFADAPEGLCDDWRAQIPEEVIHYELIVKRMEELGVDPAERPVSVRMWETLQTSVDARDFCILIASAEEWGRKAGVLLAETLEEDDPQTAAIFRRIADDEEAHVALAKIYYGWVPE